MEIWKSVNGSWRVTPTIDFPLPQEKSLRQILDELSHLDKDLFFLVFTKKEEMIITNTASAAMEQFNNKSKDVVTTFVNALVCPNQTDGSSLPFFCQYIQEGSFGGDTPFRLAFWFNYKPK